MVITYSSGSTETKSTKGTGKTKSQMKCKCGFKKDFGKGQPLLLTCPQCGEEAGAGFDIYEVPVDDDIALLKKIKTYLESLPNKSVSLEELEQQVGGDNKPTNYLPWIIGGGIILVLVIGLILYFLLKNKKRK